MARSMLASAAANPTDRGLPGPAAPRPIGAAPASRGRATPRSCSRRRPRQSRAQARRVRARREPGRASSASRNRPPARSRMRARLGRRYVEPRDHDRGLDREVGRRRAPARRPRPNSRDLGDHRARPRAQLGVGRREIDHAIAVGPAQPHHRACREHVEDELGGGAGLEARRSREDLRTRCQVQSRSRHASSDPTRHGGQPNRDGASLSGEVDRAEHVGRPAAGGNAHDHVTGARDLMARQIARAVLGSILGALDRARQGLHPPAITPRTISGETPNVGGHSAASSTPKRPELPAPT